MKLVNLKAKRTHQRTTLDQRRGPRRESSTEAVPTHHQIHTYAQLRRQIHDDLRAQHPEWVQPNGDCPMCDAYEARLMKLLETLTRKHTKKWVVALHHALDHGLN